MHSSKRGVNRHGGFSRYEIFAGLARLFVLLVVPRLEAIFSNNSR